MRNKFFTLNHFLGDFKRAALVKTRRNEREETYLPMNVEDKTRFVFNDVFSRVLLKQTLRFLPTKAKITARLLNSKSLELSKNWAAASSHPIKMASERKKLVNNLLRKSFR